MWGPLDMGVPAILDFSTGELKIAAKNEIDLRKERFRLQSAAHRLVMRDNIRHRVGFCHMGLGFGQHHVEIRKRGERANFHKLAVCGNAWVCPVCRSKIAEHRAQEIREAFTLAKEKNLHITMVTLTTRHGMGDSAESLLSGISEAMRCVTAHRDYKTERDRLGVVGYIRSLEVTHGYNGWHPHFHVIYFSKKPLPRKFQRVVFGEWKRSIKAQGLPVPNFEYGIRVNDGSKAGEYINKLGDDGELLQRRDGQGAVTWDMADEASKANLKKGRNGNRKPHQILQDASEGCEKSGLLFREYALAFHGRSMIQFSRFLRDRLGMVTEEMTDEQAAASAAGSEFHIAIPKAVWKLIQPALYRRKQARAVILQLSEHDQYMQGLSNYLAGLMVEHKKRLIAQGKPGAGNYRPMSPVDIAKAIEAETDAYYTEAAYEDHRKLQAIEASLAGPVEHEIAFDPEQRRLDNMLTALRGKTPSVESFRAGHHEPPKPS
jgi:hypothetical protein